MQTFTPHNYQKYCIQRAVSDDKLGLLLDMGLGKNGHHAFSRERSKIQPF